jgi:hypothetical protein
LIQVEEAAGAVVIRASRDTFSETRRQGFVRELAAEGFIPDRYQWLSPAAPGTAGGVRRFVDHSCFKPDQTHTAHTRRFMLRLLACAALLWLLMIGSLLLRHAG